MIKSLAQEARDLAKTTGSKDFFEAIKREKVMCLVALRTVTPDRLAHIQGRLAALELIYPDQTE